MKIIGGMANPRGVQIDSEDFSASARVGRDGTIIGLWRKKSSFEKWVRDAKYMPRVVKFFTLLVMKLPRVVRILFFGSMVALIVAEIQLIASGAVSEPELEEYSETMLRFVQVAGAIVFVLVLIRARGFHSAEHMAIAAYQQHGLDGLDRIAEQDRFHPKCGGRFLLPLFISFVVVSAGRVYLPDWGAAILAIAALEAIFWIDVLVGYDRIDFTNRVSKLLQMHLTTKPPSASELATGREALRQLLLAHEELPRNA